MKIILEEIMGETRYNLFSESILHDEGEKTAFGIAVHNASDSVHVHDITTVRSWAEAVYDTIIRNAVTPVHVKHTIENVILQ